MAKQREQIIQIAIDPNQITDANGTAGAIIALTNEGNIYADYGMGWQKLDLPDELDYAKKTESIN